MFFFSTNVIQGVTFSMSIKFSMYFLKERCITALPCDKYFAERSAFGGAGY
uniref:Uncharacterized protein n=1 Tax=Arundo donax TaxID=35708 RepID=A0A0A9E158_ARUDO